MKLKILMDNHTEIDVYYLGEPATIGHPFYQLGERAVDLLLEYFEHGITGENRQVLLKTELISGPTLRTEPLKNNQGGF